MRALLLLLLCSVPWLASAPAHAECECVWQGSFTDVEAATDLVISGTVIASKGNSIDLAAAQVLRGPEPLDPLRIWLHTADYCRPEVELFPVGTQCVMALHKITEAPPAGLVMATTGAPFSWNVRWPASVVTTSPP